MILFYHNSNVVIDKEFIGFNMPFTIGIQDKWQWKMMLMYGHNWDVSADATFKVNEKKMPTNIIVNAIYSMLFCIVLVHSSNHFVTVFYVSVLEHTSL